jgi:DNA-binding transcriptional LysR family regulator
MGWDELELLQRIAEAGTLSQAGRALSVDQTTASRRLARVEARLGVTLFDRIDGRLVATPALAAALDHLRTMAQAAHQSEAALRQIKREFDGQVRLSSVGFVLAHLLAPALGRFHAAHPRIVLDFVAEARNASFERREADISIRLARPTDETAIARRLGAVRFRLYRARSAGEAAPLVRYGEDLAHVAEMQLADRLRPGAPVALRSGQIEVLIQAALALGGEVMLPELVGDAEALMMRAPEDEAAERELFLLIHPDRRRNASVAAVVAWVEEACRRGLGAPAGRPRP